MKLSEIKLRIEDYNLFQSSIIIGSSWEASGWALRSPGPARGGDAGIGGGATATGCGAAGGTIGGITMFAMS